MSNRYGSNVRTYTARNLIWNSAASSVAPYGMNAPNDLTVISADFVKQFYRAQWPLSSVDWDRQSCLNIKKAGLFSNFADGLVFENIDTRLSFYINAHIVTINARTGTVNFTAGSNTITGTNLDVVFGPGAGFKGYIVDALAPGGNLYPYAVYDVAASGLSARISDYAWQTNAMSAIYVLTIVAGQTQSFRVTNIPVLNTLFNTEIYFRSIIGFYPIVFLECVPEILGTPNGSFDFYTKTIDTSYNTLPVTFDSLIEAEVTPI